MSAPVLSSLVGKVVSQATDASGEVVIQFTDGTTIQCDQLHDDNHNIYVGTVAGWDE